MNPNSPFKSFMIIAVVAFLAFGSGITGKFLFDDKEEILNNEHIRTLLPIWEPMLEGKGLPVRPLPYLTFALNYAVGGYNLVGYHLVNIFIQVVTAFAIYLLIFEVLKKREYLGTDTGIQQYVAMSTALLWMVHPLQTQPVNYIYQRIELMMSMFFMLTLYTFMQSVWKPAERDRKFYYLLSLISCMLGMMCKEVMVVAPVAVLWFDRVILSTSWKEVFKQRGTQHFLMFSTWLILFVIMSIQGEEYPEFKKTVRLATPWQYMLTESEVICHYLKLIVYPQPLVFDYSWPIKTKLEQVLIPGSFILSLLVVVLILMIRTPVTGFICGWFFLLLGVTSSFNPVLQPVCEHRLNLALLSPVLLFVLGVYQVSRMISQANIAQRKTMLMSITGVVLLVYISVSATRSYVYADYCSLWLDTANKQPHHVLPFYQLGTEYLNRGNNELAEKYCKEALRCDPQHGSAWNNLGLAVSRQGRKEEGAEAYRQAIKFKPELPNSYLNLGNYYLGKREDDPANLDKALNFYREALERNEKYDAAYVNMGIIYAQFKHDKAKARQYWEKALLINPQNIDALENLQTLK